MGERENRACKFRIYPTKDQEILLKKTFGCCRFIYNVMLEEKIRVYEETGRMKKKMCWGLTLR